MKGIIIYNSKYGSTRQYGEWLGENLQLPLVHTAAISKEELAGFDYFIIGSAVYMGKLSTRHWLRDNLPWLSRKRIFFFQVAGTPVEEAEKRNAYDRDSIPPELAANSHSFYLPGRLQTGKLGWKDRLIVKMMHFLTKKKGAQQRAGLDYDGVNRQALQGILTAVNRYDTGMTLVKQAEMAIN